VCPENKCLNNATCQVVQSNNLNNFENISYFCNCEKNYYGTYCENKIDLCENQTCSYHGTCIELDLGEKCKCFIMYEGEYCQFESASLKTVKMVISTASIIAILTLISLYLLMILMDLFKYFISKKRNKKKFKIKKRIAYKFHYIN
jgi:hypothetical protein